MSSCQPPQQPPLLPLFVLVGFSRAHLCSIECGVFTVQLNLLLPRALEAGTVCGNKCCSLAFLWRSSRLCIFHLSSLRCRIIETSPLRVLYSRTPSCVSSAVEKSESAYIGHNQAVAFHPNENRPSQFHLAWTGAPCSCLSSDLSCKSSRTVVYFLICFSSLLQWARMAALTARRCPRQAQSSPTSGCCNLFSLKESFKLKQGRVVFAPRVSRRI